MFCPSPAREKLTDTHTEFAPGSASSVRAATERAGGQVHYQFDDLNLLAVTLPTAAPQGIARNPNVVAIAPDELRYPMAQTTPRASTVYKPHRSGLRPPALK